ncbi:MAG: hypothetical protein NZ700_08085 [Gemmataceae bacterium]|nr:hypothetical protein [Gemmataceae bacterium]MDW8266518.1 hypothetical protein [Gemmataceae bacterium]
MNRVILLLAVCAALLGLPRRSEVAACPLCAEMAEQAFGAEQDDAQREARAYNRSIYFMVSMPYLLLAGLGLLFYRSCRMAQQRGEDSGSSTARVLEQSPEP